MSELIYTLKDLATIKYGKSQKKVVADYGSIPIYGTGGLMGYATDSIYDKPSVLIGRKGTVDKVRYIDKPFWTVDTTFYTEINEKVVLPIFFYYKMCCVDLMQFNEGTSIPSLRAETLNRMEFDIPPLSTQKKIAAVLSALDDKIELNRQINANLEQQAQAIFKNWFVDFEPFGGQMPSGWRVGKLSEIADYLNGLAMQKFRPLAGEAGLPVLKIKELRQGSFDESSELCSPSSIKNDYVIDDGDVIFSWSGSLLVDIWCGGKGGLNQHLFKVTSDKYDKWFCYIWTKHHLEKFIFVAQDKATTMGHIKRDELDKAEVIIPDSKTYKNLTKTFSPIIDTIINNRVETRKLAEMRDTLLPKLMSGEIDVSSVKV